MKKRFIALTIMLLFTAAVFGQTTSDTLYYDKDGKGVASKEFASFYRLLTIPADSNYSKMMRDYYLSGELRGQGQFQSIDRYDDKKSVFDAKCVYYYKNGNVEQEIMWKDGKIDGQWITYFDNGLIKSRANYKNGIIDGLYMKFSDDGSHCTQVEYDNGAYRYDYYVISNNDGCCTKFLLANDQPIFEPASVQDIKTELYAGKKWSSYLKNGMLIRACSQEVKDYGRYYQMLIEIANKSVVPMDFDPSLITVYCMNKQGKELPLHVYSAKEYLDKVGRRQNWDKFVNESTEYSRASEAGYSSSVTTTDAASQKVTVSGGDVYEEAKRRRGYTSYSGGSVTTNSASAVSVTESYNAAVAYQARLVADEKTANFNYELDQQRKVKEEGYLKPTTIHPGETISGYVNVEYKNGTQLVASVVVNGVTYEFTWGVLK